MAQSLNVPRGDAFGTSLAAALQDGYLTILQDSHTLNPLVPVLRDGPGDLLLGIAHGRHG